MAFRRDPPLFLALLLAVAAAGPACGASIQALYESDVRFEHCMALDTRDDVKATLRRSCWDEWLSYYTFGQTRDRIEHARMRVRNLGTSSDFDERSASLPPPAVPDPTSPIAPPPMLLATDAGASPSADTKCQDACADDLALCRRTCRGASCERICSERYKRCMRKCF